MKTAWASLHVQNDLARDLIKAQATMPVARAHLGLVASLCALAGLLSLGEAAKARQPTPAQLRAA